jgi:hypothetical protein
MVVFANFRWGVSMMKEFDTKPIEINSFLDFPEFAGGKFKIKSNFIKTLFFNLQAPSHTG